VLSELINETFQCLKQITFWTYIDTLFQDENFIFNKLKNSRKSKQVLLGIELDGLGSRIGIRLLFLNIFEILLKRKKNKVVYLNFFHFISKSIDIKL